jgi:hypothetical protein
VTGRAPCINCAQVFTCGAPGSFGFACSRACYDQHQNRIALARSHHIDLTRARPSSAPDPIIMQAVIDNLPQILSHCHPDRHGNSQASNEITRLLLRARNKSKGKT